MTAEELLVERYLELEKRLRGLKKSLSVMKNLLNKIGKRLPITKTL